MDILVAVDFSGISDAVLERAGQVAGAFAAKIWLIHVAEPRPDFVGWDPSTPFMREQVAALYRQEHRDLHELANTLRLRGHDCEALLIPGAAAPVILDQAARLGAGMIVLGSQGKGAVERFVIGSTSLQVMQRSPVPVLVVPLKRHE